MFTDIRWQQRFSNFEKALVKLNKAVQVIEEQTDFRGDLEEVLQEGLIQRFEYTHELAWNVMKDYAKYQGNNSITGSRDATREAFKMGLIADADVWMDMLQSRNLTTHTYDSNTAAEIRKRITDEFAEALNAFAKHMTPLKIG